MKGLRVPQDDEEYYDVHRDYKEHKRERRINNLLHARDIEQLLELEDDYE